MSQLGDLLVGRIKKNRRDSVVIRWRKYQGVRFLDLRLHHMEDDGDVAATTNGFTLKPQQLSELQRLLKFAENIGKAHGVFETAHSED